VRWGARTKEGPNQHSNSPGSLGNVSHTPGRIGVSKTCAACWESQANFGAGFASGAWAPARPFRESRKGLAKSKARIGCGRSPNNLHLRLYLTSDWLEAQQPFVIC